MNFTDAVQTGFKKYVEFNGRATRSEYWYWALFTFILFLAAAMVSFSNRHMHDMLNLLITVVIFLPTLSVGIRRLHDIDRSGWWILIGLIPLIGSIVQVVWFCTKGTQGSNRFG